MDKLSRKRTNRVKKKKEPDPFNTKLSTTHKFIIAIIFGTIYEIGQKRLKNMNVRSAGIGHLSQHRLAVALCAVF